MTDEYRPLAGRIQYAMAELGTPIDAEDADAIATTLERDHITDLYMTVTDTSINLRCTRQRRRDGRRRNG